MEGFKLFDDNGLVRILEPEELQSLTQSGEIDFPCITENEIRDRSKGDVLSKALVVIQAGWFVLQCIARRIERLPTTELELVTLAFAALNFMTYGLWWNKPLNVQCPVCVRRKGETEGRKCAGESSQRPDDENGLENNGGQGTGAKAVLGILLATIGNAIVRKTPEAISEVTGAIVDTIRESIEDSVEYVRRHRWWTLWNGVEAAVERGIADPIKSFASMGDGDIVGGMFYAGDSGGVSKELFVNAAAVIATIFGAIHCVAWSFKFPSYTEQLLWRIASLSITCLPMGYVFVKFVFGLLEDVFDRKVEDAVVFGIAILYILSRVTLLVIALISLRSLPPGAYETVHWTTFIPHV